MTLKNMIELADGLTPIEIRNRILYSKKSRRYLRYVGY